MTKLEFHTPGRPTRRIVLSFASDVLTTKFHLVKGQPPSVLRTRGQESNEVIAILRAIFSTSQAD